MKKRRKQQKKTFVELKKLINLKKELQKSKNDVETRAKLNQDVAMFNETIHEVRKLNNQIKASIGQLGSKVKDLNKGSDYLEQTRQITNICKSLAANSSLLSIRMDAYDVLLNPQTLEKDMFVNMNVYSKIEKVYKCLYAQRKEKNVDVRMNGYSTLQFHLNNQMELAFFIIIENAIKYTYNGAKIDIYFTTYEHNSDLEVVFKNWGIKPDKDEENRLFERGFRSSKAKSAKINGSGLGLFILSQICDANNVIMDIAILDDNYYYDGLRYSPFALTLKFMNNKHF